MSTKAFYLVIVNYQTSQNGNDGTARIRVKAENESQAIDLAIKKASSYTRVGKVVGGHVDGSPAPTDWMKEFAAIQGLRDKAKQYIVSNTPADGLFVGGFYVQVGPEFVEVRHIGIGKDGHITLNDKEIVPIVSADVPDSDWVMLAGIVQDAITESN